MPLCSDSWFFAFCCFPKTFSWVFGNIPFFLDWKKMHICGESLQLSFWKMEKDFFVTCHGLSFSRRLLSKGFQAVQEKECIIYDIFVSGSGFFWAGKIPSLCAQDGTYPHQWMSSVFWREERKFFPSECCQIASWTHVAKESSWAISINRKYILTLHPNSFLPAPLCSAWMNVADSYSVAGC